ncbi:MAG: hypothetical protein CBD02_00125 [Candidatus Pelagibacter sp. TMED142]|nr:MAG: hypothetical protein CBD02_00125 [Candidatus Pelagibacter sp. TMED142]|tara:strand:- start:3338 stop:4399 length:1062 start_codon:yes stop_codon:yes gene_type:complete
MLGKYFKNRYEKLSVKKKQKIAAVPKNALIELTNACNHACVFCFNPEMKRKTKGLDFKIFEDFIKNSIKEGLEEVGLYSTGEPFMTKNLEKYVKKAKELGAKRVYITSNGALASIDKVIKCIDAGLDSIKFSINAGSRETYKIIHGYDDFDKVIKNLSDIYNYKLKNNINFKIFGSFVITNITLEEKDMFIKNYGNFFEDIFFQKARNQGGRTLDKRNTITSNIKSKEIKDSSKKLKPCGMLWDRLHLTAEGYLTACCEDYENDLVYKKFNNKEKVFDQFNNAKIQNLRKMHLNSKLDGTICKGCLLNKKFDYKKISKIEVKNNKINLRKANSLKERIEKAKSFKKIINERAS